MASKDRLKNLFSKIKDKELKQIIAEVVNIERNNRTSSRENFPRQKVRDVIDSIARLQELGKDDK